MLVRLFFLFLVFLITSMPVRTPPANELWVRGYISNFNLAYTVKRIMEAKPGESLLVKINSQGGQFDPAVVLINAMDAAHNRGVIIRCEVDWLAASAAFLILEGCPTRSIHIYSLVLAHQVFYTHLEKPSPAQIMDLQTTNHQVALFAATRMGIPVETYKRMTTGKDWWLTAHTALAYGAVDEIIGVRFLLGDKDGSRIN